MPSSKKCINCNLCLDTVWVGPRRFYHCFLCGNYYDIIDNKVVVVDVDKELKLYMDMSLNQQEKANERFK